jgi:hypothetical protein
MLFFVFFPGSFRQNFADGQSILSRMHDLSGPSEMTVAPTDEKFPLIVSETYLYDVLTFQ